VLVLSQRRLHRPIWQAMQYEFEDALTWLDDVDLLAPLPVGPPALSSASRRLVNGPLRRVGGPRRSPPWYAPSARTTRVTADHDLFFAVFHYAYQVSYLERLHDWRRRCRRSAAVLIEAWSSDAQDNLDYLRMLGQFDVVYLFNPAIAPLLRSLGVRDVRFLPMAVDTAAFAPVPLLPDRVLDVYSFGRSSEVTHRALLRLVQRQGLTYLYDTLEGGHPRDVRDHRALLANMVKRAQFFLTYRINDSPDRRARTGGDEGLTTRYFEGAAGGAVLLGSRTPSPEFDACFDWEDAVVPVPYASDDIGERLAELLAGPDRIARARAANVRNSLLRHDWLHRWETVLADAGLPATEGMGRRREALEGLAAGATPEVFAARAPRWVAAGR
jgi:hypothetical protein